MANTQRQRFIPVAVVDFFSDDHRLHFLHDHPLIAPFNPQETTIDEIWQWVAEQMKADPTLVTLWKPKEYLTRLNMNQLEEFLKDNDYKLEAFCDNISDDGESLLSSLLADQSRPRDAKLPLLVARIRKDKTSKRKRSDQETGVEMDEATTSEARDVITEIKTHYQRLVTQQNRLTPSANCNPANYYTHQNGICPILDGRYGDSPNTIAPPVEIYHSAFASFVAEDRYDAPDVPTDFVQKVAKLLRTVSQIATTEKSRQATTRSLLSDLLNLTIVQMVNRNSTSADHIVTYHRGSQPLGAAAIAIIEEKSELGSSGDASVQGSFSFIEHWADSNQNALRAACFCPSFVIAVAGSWIVICGAVLTSSAVVHRLTDYIWLGHSRAMDDDRALRLARTFYALGRAIKSLESFYKELVPPHDENARFFPLATAYKVGEQTINFKYVKPLKGSDASCATFLAAECEGAQRRIVVKFVERYGVRAHRLLAEERLAPELLYYGDIWLSGPEQRGCGPRKMVVMEYVAGMTAGDAALKNDGILPSGVHPAVYRAMSLLHKHGMVHGDVRLPNIIIEEDHEGKDVRDRVKIVDFDWAGEDGKVRYPLHLSTAIRWADGVDDYEPITAAHDDAMVTKLQQ